MGQMPPTNLAIDSLRHKLATKRSGFLSHKLAQIQERFLAAYRAQDWDEAESLAEEALFYAGESGMDGYYGKMKERLVLMRGADLPADWDGVFALTSK